VTAEALAAKFEVSVRTIYRDVDELSAAGVPVYADRGPGGGFQLRDGYRTQLTGLTPDEADTLLLVGLTGPAGDLGFGPAMLSAERKILAAMPASHAARALQVRRRVLLDPLDWYRRAEQPRFLPLVAQAVWAQTKFSIRYQSWTGRKLRTVEPWGLVIKAGVWYVVACVNQSVRAFRISQIEELKASSERFEVPADFDLASHWMTELRRFEKELQRARATVRVAASAMSRIERLGADAAEAIRAAVPEASGRRTAIIPIEGVEHAAIELLGFGAWIEVIKPATLRRRLHELGAQVALLNRNPR
jgi:predicted DNA-binding transcriptional regulator YafY